MLARFGAQERRRRLMQGALAFLIVLGVGPLVLLSLDLALGPPEWARTALVGTYLLALAVAGGSALIFVLAGPSEEELALMIERRSPRDFHNTLIAAVQLPEAGTTAVSGISASLVEATRESAAGTLEGIDLTRLSHYQLAQRLAIAAAVVGLFCLPAVFRGKDRLTYRYLVLAVPKEQVPVSFKVQPGSTKVLKGARLDITAEVVGLPADGDPVVLHRWQSGQEPERFEMRRQPDGKYSLFFPTVTEAFGYRLQSGLFESPQFQITTVLPPEIRTLTLTYRRPEYTRLPKQVQKDPPYDITALVGTEVDLAMEPTKALKSAWIDVFGTHVPLVSGTSGAGPLGATLTVSQSGDYVIHLQDQDGFENPSPPRFQIYAIQDQVPQVVLLKPGTDLSLQPSELTTLPLKIYAEDDYGLAKVTLKAKFRQRNDFKYEETQKEYPITLPPGSQAQVTLDHVWDLTQKVLQPGDSITYWVEATDQAPAAKGLSRAGLSKTYLIDLPLAVDVANEVSKEQKEEVDNLAELANRQKVVEERLNKVMRDLGRSRKVTYKEKKELEQLVAKQSEIKKKSEDLSQRMQQVLDTMRKHELVDPGSIEKLGEIQKLFSEVASSKMKELMNQMRDLMQQSQLDPEKLEELSKKFNKKDYSKQLDRILESLKRLKSKQELQRISQELDAMTKMQEQLRSETARRTQQKENTSELAKSQEDLEKRADQLFKDVKQQSEQMKVAMPEVAKQLEQMQNESKHQELSKEMQEARNELKQQHGQQAFQHQSQALQQMNQMRQQMSEAQSQMNQKQMSIDLEAVKTLISLGLAVSRIQEEVTTAADSRAAVAESRKGQLELAGLQYGASRGVLEFERGFEKGFADEVMFKNIFLDQISQIVNEMEEAKDNFENSRLYSGRQLARQSLSRLNIVLLKLLELLDQMNNQSQGQGMDGFFDQMEKMIQNQRQLNQQTKRLQEQGQQGTQFFQQMMMQQALEQQMIREALEKLSKKYGKAKELLGKMDGLGDDMKDLEERLKKLDPSDRTQEKQEHVLTRMLELNTSAKTQGESRKRKAEAATA